MYILETLNCNSSESYRHIVAWVYIFQEAGYQVINPRGTLDDANDLHAETLSIVNTLRPISLNKVLAETKYCTQVKTTTTDLALQQEEKIATKKTTREKITVWTTREEKDSFVAFAKSLKLTQSQTIQYLISKIQLESVDPLFPDWDNDIFIRLLKQSYEQKIAQLENKVFKLETIQNQRKEGQNVIAKKMGQSHAITKQTILDFYKYFDSDSPVPVDIERTRYKDYLKNLPGPLTYKYPRCSGSTLIRMHTLLLGEGSAPARFVLGMDPHDCPIMLRFYDSVYFSGISPSNKRFSQRNSVWYMAWKMTGKVAELISAFPLQIRPKYRNPMDASERLAVLVDKIVTENDALCKSDEIF